MLAAVLPCKANVSDDVKTASFQLFQVEHIYMEAFFTLYCSGDDAASEFSQ